MSRTLRPSSSTVGRRWLISTVAVMLMAAAALLSHASNVARAMDTLSGSIAKHPAEMIPP